MRSGPLISAFIGVGAWLVALALEIIAVPDWLGLLALAAGAGCLIVAGLWWIQGRLYTSAQRLHQPDEQPSPGKVIAEYEATKSAHARRQRKAVVKQLREPRSPVPTVTSEQARKAADLLMESDDIRPRLLTAIRDGKRLGFPWLSTGLADEVHKWNDRVVALADECMTIEEATEVATYPRILRGIAGAGGQALAAMLDDNRRTLAMLIRRSQSGKAS